MSDRIYKQFQESLLYEAHFAKRMLASGKADYMLAYFDENTDKYRNGLSNDEADATIARAESAAKKRGAN